MPLPAVLKLTLTSLATLTVLLVAGFLALAWWNGRDDASGPPPVLTISVSDAGATPSRIEVKKGKLIDLTLDNNTSQSLRLSTEDVRVDQLVAGGNEDAFATHTGQSLTSVYIVAPASLSRSAVVRFREKGTFELRIEGDAASETRTVAIEVR